MIKIIMLFDQIQSGLGTKDDKMIPLGGTKEMVGPAVMLSPMLKEIDAKIVASFYCGNGTFMEDPEEISRKICVKLNQLNPDIVICGPSFNYEEYSLMCAKIAKDINEKTKTKAFAAMSRENEKVIEEYKDKILITETPKKGGVGLNDSLKNIVNIVQRLSKSESFDSIKKDLGYK